MKRREIIKRRKRAAVFLWGAVLAVIIGSLFIRCKADSDKVYYTYTVSSGDTLWSIAREIYGDSCDIRYKIDDIEQENGITDARIYEGMRLRICVSD